MNLKKILILLSLLIFTPTLGEELKKENFSDHELNFYSGMFDFSDDGKRSTIFGIQHQDESLLRDTFLGTLSPVSGIMVTADTAGYIYTGVQAQYKFGNINVTPSFTPGLYHEGEGKDLGHPV